ncbi:MAG: hypothetical protein M1826_005737 [Phylliscum demangeonii]|nr:MAG: hypothetical protein M1826_005737 [Phylliscum demangeonii]
MSGPTPPPDFPVIAQALSAVSEQVDRLPSYLAGNSIAELLAFLTDFRREVTGEMRAERYNNVARIENSRVLHSETPLVSLLDVRTNEAIIPFPRTPPELDRLGLGYLHSSDLTRILTALGQPALRQVDALRQRLRSAIGLVQKF